MFPNTGNMGCRWRSCPGDEGLAFAVIYFAISITSQFTISVASGSLASLLRMPLIYAIVFALIVLSFGWQLPAYRQYPAIAGGVTIPLMLLALGVRWRNCG
jgi:predicted permease